MTQEWTRLPEDRWFCREFPEHSKYARCIDRREYAEQGKEWPRIHLTIHAWRSLTFESWGIRIGTSWKDSPGGRWEPCEVPESLIPELIGMLQSLPKLS